MPKIYYSKTTRGFHSEASHGSRFNVVDDPEGGDPVYVENPDCKIPADGVEVSEAARNAFVAPAAGQRLVHPTLEEDSLLPWLEDIPPLSAGDVRSAEILGELVKIDRESVRPIRAVLSNTNTADDDTKLATLNGQATALRAELAAL